MGSTRDGSRRGSTEGEAPGPRSQAPPDRDLDLRLGLDLDLDLRLGLDLGLELDSDPKPELDQDHVQIVNALTALAFGCFAAGLSPRSQARLGATPGSSAGFKSKHPLSDAGSVLIGNGEGLKGGPGEE